MRITMASLLLVALLSVVGCGGGVAADRKAAVEEGLAIKKEAAGVLARIRDAASANASKAKMEELGKKMKDLRAKMPVDRHTPGEMKKIAEPMKAQLDEADAAFRREYTRVDADPATGGPVGKPAALILTEFDALLKGEAP